MKNIILLALSDYKDKKSNNYFRLKETGEIVVTDCDGQMEPLVKLALREYPGQQLEIIMLCTEKTMSPVIKGKSLSSVEYFKERVQGFSAGTMVSFKEIRLDEDKPVEAIHEAVAYIRSIHNEAEHFWIDTHGGFRDVVLMMEAIVSILKAENIAPDHIWGIQFADNEEKYIVNQKESFSIFDFVAGMNEFINFGSVTMLQMYYKSHEKSEPERALLEAMKQVSDGAQESDPTKYIEGLDLLGKRIKNIGESNTLMKIFRDYLETGYGDLLYPEKRTVTGIIRHCINKGFVMQALTFAESLMPAEFISHHIIEFNKEELKRLRELDDLKRFAWKSDDNFLIDSYIRSNWTNAYFVKKTCTKMAVKRYINVILGKSISGQYELNDSFFQRGKVLRFGMLGRNKEGKIRLTTVVSPKDRATAGRVMRLHRVLKECRNAIVHCKSDRSKIEDVVHIVRLYLDETEKLFSKYPIPYNECASG